MGYLGCLTKINFQMTIVTLTLPIYLWESSQLGRFIRVYICITVHRSRKNSNNNMPHGRVGGCLLCIMDCWWQWANWHCSSSAAPSLIVHLVALVQKKATFLGQTHGCTQNAWEGMGIQEWVFKNPELLKAAGSGLKVEWIPNNKVLSGTKRGTPGFLSSRAFSHASLQLLNLRIVLSFSGRWLMLDFAMGLVSLFWYTSE